MTRPRKRTATIVGAVAVSLGLVSTVAATAGEELPPRDRMVLLEDWSEYGRALYTDCKLSVMVWVHHGGEESPQHSGRKAVRCGRGRGRPALVAVQNFGALEARGVLDALDRAALFATANIGTDTRASDGYLRILHVKADRHSTALIVSGNDEFRKEGPRRALRIRLDAMLQALLEVALAGE